MPEDFQAHSSFNTLDKADKPPKRSASPEATAQTSSFGVATTSSTDNLTGAQAGSPLRYQDMPPNSHAGSPPRYQDMPPNYNNGTNLWRTVIADIFPLFYLPPLQT